MKRYGDGWWQGLHSIVNVFDALSYTLKSGYDDLKKKKAN
jgi:hypothetical protein